MPRPPADLAHQHREDDRDGEAEHEREQREPGGVRDGDAQNCGSASTRRKLSRPTQVGSDTRFVSWKLITTARTIGNQANTPNTTRNGSRNASVPSPSRVIRSRRVRRPGVAAAAAGGAEMTPVPPRSAFPCAPATCLDRRTLARRAPGRERMPAVRETRAATGRAPAVPGPRMPVGCDQPASRIAWTWAFAASSRASMSAFLSVSTAWTTGSRAA